ncbi:MAG: cell envelope integrity protein TolA [bacterium]|nr:cell envelope integrity protein TolA [bacterium]
MLRKIEDKHLKVGVTVSSIGHVFFFTYMAFNGVFGAERIKPQVIYSVTLEGGKTLGAISQAPKDKKSDIAPPKKVQEPKKTQKEEKKVEKKEEIKKEQVLVPKKEEKKKVEDKPKVDPKKKVETKKNEKTEKPIDLDKRLQQAVQRYTGESTSAGGKGFGAGRLGGEKLGGGVQRPPEFFTYKQILEDYIKTGWRWFDPRAQLSAQVDFELLPDGKVQNISLSSSSGVTEFDESVVRAVNKANPVPPPPESVYEFFRQVRITFVPTD